MAHQSRLLTRDSSVQLAGWFGACALLCLSSLAFAQEDIEGHLSDHLEAGRVAEEDATEATNDDLPGADSIITVAVYPLQLEGIPDGMGRIVSEQLLGEIPKAAWG